MSDMSVFSASFTSIQWQQVQSNPQQNASQCMGPTGSQQQTGGPGGFMASVLQTLGQLGINVPGVNSAPNSSTTTNSSTSTAAATSTSATSQSPGDALHAFMQSLFQALQANASTQSGNGTQTGSGGHHHHHHHGGGDGGQAGGLASAISNLANSLSASSTASSSSTGNSGSGNSSTADQGLNSAFQNLVSALGGASSSSTTPTLQTFLQDLATNLQSQTQNNPTTLITSA